jgi:hypothetical protein
MCCCVEVLALLLAMQCACYLCTVACELTAQEARYRNVPPRAQIEPVMPLTVSRYSAVAAAAAAAGDDDA